MRYSSSATFFTGRRGKTPDDRSNQQRGVPPVSDIDRAKTFYVEKLGLSADHDHQVSDELRFVQLTPPGSACSIALTSGAH